MKLGVHSLCGSISRGGTAPSAGPGQPVWAMEGLVWRHRPGGRGWGAGCAGAPARSGAGTVPCPPLGLTSLGQLAVGSPLPPLTVAGLSCHRHWRAASTVKSQEQYCIQIMEFSTQSGWGPALGLVCGASPLSSRPRAFPRGDLSEAGVSDSRDKMFLASQNPEK